MRTKIKTGLLSLATLIVMSLPSVTIAQDSLPPSDEKWVCCQATSTGCTDRLGFHYPDDYKSFTEVCGCVCPPTIE